MNRSRFVSTVRTLLAAGLAALSLGAFAAVDVNRASQAELETVKGIGPGLSGKILEARKSGAFKDWGDFVDRVGGVGPGNAAKFSQAGLTVGGSGYGGASAPEAQPGKGDKPARAKNVKADASDKAEAAVKPAK